MSDEVEMREDGRVRLPPGQFLTTRFPVLTYGDTPNVEMADWKFTLSGHGIESEVELGYDEMLNLGKTDITRDFHCVTTWSRYDNTWSGIPVEAVVEWIEAQLGKSLAEAGVGAVLLHCVCGYTANLLLEDFVAEGNLFATHHDGEPLTADHGGPMRFVCHHLYAWKSAKWVSGIELLTEDVRGFWERNGYHIRGDPWHEERYAYQE